MLTTMMVATILVVKGSDEWLRVPGGVTIHESCFHEVDSGSIVDVSSLVCDHMICSAAMNISNA
jgi:hypothetical protein